MDLCAENKTGGEIKAILYAVLCRIVDTLESCWNNAIVPRDIERSS